ncbi:MAG TPA: hypothetical protein VGD94_15405 [Vicinamibacterales bacterium]
MSVVSFGWVMRVEKGGREGLIRDFHNSRILNFRSRDLRGTAAEVGLLHVGDRVAYVARPTSGRPRATEIYFVESGAIPGL